MNDNHNFRIIEYLGRFTVQRKDRRKVGLFKKKDICEWRNIDRDGYFMINRALQIRHPDLDSLEKAENIVKSLKEGLKITYYD